MQLQYLFVFISEYRIIDLNTRKFYMSHFGKIMIHDSCCASVGQHETKEQIFHSKAIPNKQKIYNPWKHIRVKK